MSGDGWAPPPAAGGDGSGGKQSGWRSWLIIVGLAVVLAGMVVAGLTLADGSDGGDSADRADTDAPADDPATTITTSRPSTTTTRPTTTTAPPWQDVASADGMFHVRLPGGWASITVRGDMTGRGAEMFPTDPPHASLADQVLSLLITPQSRFVALDGNAPPFVEETDILLVENGESNVGQQTAYDALKRSIEGQVRREGTLQTAAGVANWLEYAPANVPGIVARNYLIVRYSTAWVLTFWSGDMDHRAGVADLVVGSFTLT
jgi:hypothetical protein